MASDKNINKEYWEKNIGGFAGFYDKKSEENLMASSWFSFLYKAMLFPIEKKYMKDRYDIVMAYIDKNVSAGTKIADVGCGSGIFIKRMLAKGAFVYAFDYAAAAVALVKGALSEQDLKQVELKQFDILANPIPDVDVVISIGVLTYIADDAKYFDHILPHTKKFFFNFLDSRHVLNRIRMLLPILNVRKISFHHYDKIIAELKKRNFKVNRIVKLATGYMIEAEVIT